MTHKEKEIINTNKAVIVNFPAHINAHHLKAVQLPFIFHFQSNK